MAYEYMIGTTLEGMQDLATIGLAASPHPSYRPFSDAVKDGTGATVGQGSPIAEWHWDVMKIGESDLLENYLDGTLSALVYIRTRLNRLTSGDYSWGTFLCLMHWPTGDEEIQSRRNLSLTIQFTNMVLIPDEEEEE